MASKPWQGIDLAVLYGLGLIVAAIVLALLYALLCKSPAPRTTVVPPAFDSEHGRDAHGTDAAE